MPYNNYKITGSMHPFFIIFLLLFNGLSNKAYSQTPDQQKPPLSSDETFNAVSEFFQYDRNFPLLPIIIAKADSGTYWKEKIVFNGSRDSKVVGYFAYPKSTTPSPLVILIDGIYGSKERWWINDSWPQGGLMTKTLLNAGFAVLVLDAPYHGERTYENNFLGPQNIYNQPNWTRELLVQETIEHRRAMDYMFNRKEVNSNRIASLGLSLGGLITFNLAALDSRIKVAIAGLTPSIILSPVLYVTNFARKVQGQPFLMIMGRKDWNYSVKDAQEMYEMIPSTSKNLIFYDLGHEVPVEYVKVSVDWLTKYLK